MNAKRYTTEKWFEKGSGLKVRLKVIYLLVDCYFKSRGHAAMRENAPPVIRCNWESYRRSVGGEHA